MSIRLARLLLVLFMLTPILTATSRAATIDPAAMAYRLPATIEWRDNPNNPGVKSAVLYGDPTKPGPYVVRVKWLPGNMSRPHSHPNDRFIVVLSGSRRGSAPAASSAAFSCHRPGFAVPTMAV